MKKINLVLFALAFVAAAAFVSCKNDPTQMKDVTNKNYYFDSYTVTGTIKQTTVETQTSGNPVVKTVTTTVDTYDIKAPEGSTDKKINNAYVSWTDSKTSYGNMASSVKITAYNLYAAVKETEQVTTDGNAADAVTNYDMPSTSIASTNTNFDLGAIELYPWQNWNQYTQTQYDGYCEITLYKGDDGYYIKSGSGLVKVDVDETSLKSGKTFTLKYTEKLNYVNAKTENSTSEYKDEATIDVDLTFTAK